jgi:catechol 2,3-dioxygenase-like lactoylglutathione lyase family enzyme
MIHCNGVHHLAISTADIKAQIAFFNDVLGMQLVALYWMHGVEGAWHGFMRMNDQSSIAFVQTPEIAKLERELGHTHSGSPGGPSAGGTMQHLAFNVDSFADLLAMRDRIRSRGITVVGPIHHGLCDSIYFAGPEDLSLEVSTSEKPIDGRAWIDPEVVALAGISAAELERFRKPAEFASQGGALAQPPIDPAKPWMRGWPPGVLEHFVAMTDEEFTARMSETEPPVKVPEERP